MLLPPWPTITVETESEPDALEVIGRLVACLGPLPQAELLEPWDRGDAWRVRVDVPDLTPQQARQLRAEPGLHIEPGRLPGARAAEDQRAVLADELGSAVLWSDAVEGGLCLPDLAEEAAEPAGATLASELLAAVQGVSAELVPDLTAAIDFVRHRPTGRRGLRVQVPATVLERLSGEELLAVRHDVVKAVRAVVERRADSEISLAPDLLWDPRMGLAVIAWRRDASGPALPGDSVVEAGLEPPMEHLPALDLAGRVHSLEIQVVPTDPALHDAVAMGCAELLVGSPLVGSEPRWVFARLAAGVRPCFCPCWRVPAQELPDLGVHLARLVEAPDVHAVRVVPIDPVGLEDVAGYLDPAWRWTGSHWVVRWRDGVRDRDRLVAWVTRPADAADAGIAQVLSRVIATSPGIEVVQDAEGRRLRPIIDDQGRAGLGLHLAPALATDPLRLGWFLGALGSVPLPGWSDIIDLALPVDGVVLHLWRRPAAAAEAEPPVWVSVG